MSCSNDCATIQSYTIPVLESIYGNIPSGSWQNHSSDVVKWGLRGRKSRESNVYKHSSDVWLSTQYHHLEFDSNIKHNSLGFCFIFVQEKWSHGAQKNETFYRGQSDCGILSVGNPSVAHNVCFLCHIWPSAAQHLRIIRLLWKLVICNWLH